MALAERVAENLYILDTGMLGLERYGALYILKAPKVAIIESGLFAHGREDPASPR
jgi:hypothetical protein